MSSSEKLNSASVMSAKFEPRFRMNPIGPLLFNLFSIPLILIVMKHLIAFIFRDSTKIFLTLTRSMSENELLNYALMHGQTFSFG